MNLLVAILIFVLLCAVIAIVGAPLRGTRGARAGDGVGGAAGGDAGREQLARDELEAAREAKYREIRDAELDYRTGKLSREDYEAIDRTLRAEAIEILDRLGDGEGRG